ncbi:MAG: TonB-dependent receptor, partial [Candidatus Cloacimonetes bacterium]|nr:TonB-dependent receptor [Candidatus Cloacimonadota bacterium]
MKKILLASILSLILIMPLSLVAAENGAIAGMVEVKETGKALAGANVYLEEVQMGTLTLQNGKYIIKNVKPGNYKLHASLMGYIPQIKDVEVKAGLVTTVNFSLAQRAINLEGINVIADRAKTQKTPIAFSDVDKEEISESLGSRDVPLALKSTPSLYSTMQGGGSGDARVNIRGFNQRNVAVMINGVPVNDMENGWVYWSNWDGLGDATSSIQVQRGLSAINLAVPSIGGAINMITDPTKQTKGVNFQQEYGSANFKKQTLTANSGLVNDKYAFSMNFTRKTGDGTVDKTWTDAWSYYLAASYNVNESNRLELYAVGAPQRHGQNLYKQNMAVYNREYTKEHTEYMADSTREDYYSDFKYRGMDFNQNWSPVNPDYKGKQWWDGDQHNRYSPYYINSEENYYHKPQVNLNWFAKLNEKMNLYSILYYSGGKGGGTGTFGDVYRKDANGQTHVSTPFYYGPSPWVFDWNKSIEVNQAAAGSYWVDGDSLYKEEGEALGVIRNSVNQQWTIGAISRATYDLNNEVNTTIGIDWRTAEIKHYREIRDMLGGEYFYWDGNEFDKTEEDYKKKLGDKIDYYNVNTVDWIGGYAQGEYSKDKLSAYGMGGLSAVKYSYTDHFVADPDDSTAFNKTEADWISGYQFKGGASYRANNNFGVYANAGYVSKCPILDEVINDWNGRLLDDIENEKFSDIETGFNWVGMDGLVNVNGNIYVTNWNDQAKSVTVYDEDLDADVKVFMNGIDSRHMGVELQANAQ